MVGFTIYPNLFHRIPAPLTAQQRRELQGRPPVDYSDTDSDDGIETVQRPAPQVERRRYDSIVLNRPAFIPVTSSFEVKCAVLKQHNARLAEQVSMLPHQYLNIVRPYVSEPERQVTHHFVGPHLPPRRRNAVPAAVDAVSVGARLSTLVRRFASTLGSCLMGGAVGVALGGLALQFGFIPTLALAAQAALIFILLGR